MSKIGHWEGRAWERMTAFGLEGGLLNCGSLISLVDGNDTRLQRAEEDWIVLNEASKNQPLIQRNWRTRTFEKTAVSSELCSKWGLAYKCVKMRRSYWKEIGDIGERGYVRISFKTEWMGCIFQQIFMNACHARHLAYSCELYRTIPALLKAFGLVSK